MLLLLLKLLLLPLTLLLPAEPLTAAEVDTEAVSVPEEDAPMPAAATHGSSPLAEYMSGGGRVWLGAGAGAGAGVGATVSRGLSRTPCLALGGSRALSGRGKGLVMSGGGMREREKLSGGTCAVVAGVDEKEGGAAVLARVRSWKRCEGRLRCGAAPLPVPPGAAV
jgi:hypothetical protein